MKKIATFFAAAAFVVALSSCGSKPEEAPAAETTETPAAEAPAAEAPAADMTGGTETAGDATGSTDTATPAETK